jgi:serine/threonine protein kinase HipA of HipAB toxin-antitoxin module
MLENFYYGFPVIMERRANEVQLGQVMKSTNEIITAILLEYVERQIVINNVKFSTTKKENKIQIITFDSICRYHKQTNKPGQFLSAGKIHCELLSTENDFESNQYALWSNYLSKSSSTRHM